MRKKVTRVLPILTLFIVYFVWLLTAQKINTPIILPSPNKVAESFFGLLVSRKFHISCANSFLRVIYSFVFSYALALPLGYFSAKSEIVNKLLYPLVVICRAVPTMAVILILVIWVSPLYSPMYIAFIVTFPISFAAVFESVKNIPKEYIELAKVYKIEKAEVLKKFTIPYLADKIYSQSIAVISFNAKVVIAGEALAQTYLSLGRLMQTSYLTYDMSSLFAYAIAAILLSYFAELLLKAVGFFVKLIRRLHKNAFNA